LIIDIDFFKKINDTYGHIEADKILEKLAQILKTAVRNSDLVARFGGEEFVILFPETNLNKAIKVCKRINKNIEKDKFLKKYKLTISGGLTEYKQRDNIRKMQERADKALYEAKKTGRDRIIIFGKTKKKV
jgi:diguanylate cyclase (GGDEF)-like protein